MKIKERQKNKLLVQSKSLLYYKNVLKCSQGNSEKPQHRLTKYWIASYCWEHGLEFATEVSFKGSKGRADIVIFDWALVIEVCHSEKLRDALAKKYPLYKLAIPTWMHHFDIIKMLSELDVNGGDTWIVDRYQERILQMEKAKKKRL